MVFAAVRTHFPRKTPACLVNRTAINEQQFEYNNEHDHEHTFLFFLSFFFFLVTLKDK